MIAGNLELAEYGHAKDNPNLPQVNMSLGYNQTGNKPVFLFAYPGSIIDNTECEKIGRKKRNIMNVKIWGLYWTEDIFQ